MSEYVLDFYSIIKTLWKKKLSIIGFVFLCVVISIIYSYSVQKVYKSEASFFVNSQNKASSSLMGYASVLGLNTPSNLENLIKNVLNSESMKIQLADRFKDKFKNQVQNAIKAGIIQDTSDHVATYVISLLGLRTQLSIQITKDNLFRLSYVSNDPQFCKDILDQFLALIMEFNDNLELSAEKNIITLVDPPRVPIDHFKPNKKMNVILAFGSSLIFACLFVLVLPGIKDLIKVLKE